MSIENTQPTNIGTDAPQTTTGEKIAWSLFLGTLTWLFYNQ